MDMKETTKYPQSEDWVFASRRNEGRSPLWPGVVLQKSRPARGCTSGHLQKVWLAYLSTYVLDSLDCQRRERQGCAGVDASRKQPLHPSDLQSGANQNEEGCTESIGGSAFSRRKAEFPAYSGCGQRVGKASVGLARSKMEQEILMRSAVSC